MNGETVTDGSDKGYHCDDWTRAVTKRFIKWMANGRHEINRVMRLTGGYRPARKSVCLTG